MDINLLSIFVRSGRRPDLAIDWEKGWLTIDLDVRSVVRFRFGWGRWLCVREMDGASAVSGQCKVRTLPFVLCTTPHGSTSVAELLAALRSSEREVHTTTISL